MGILPVTQMLCVCVCFFFFFVLSPPSLLPPVFCDFHECNPSVQGGLKYLISVF
jgi:hypothetical protein